MTSDAHVASVKRLWKLSFKSNLTQRGYGRDLEKFEAFLIEELSILRPTPRAAPLTIFIALPSDKASDIVAKWLHEMHKNGMADETINRSLSAVRSFIGYAWEAEITAVRIKAPYRKAAGRRDNRGCDLGGVRKILAEARQQKRPRKAARDEALLLLLFAQGLRRREIVTLNVADFDPEKGTLVVTGKGAVLPEEIVLAPETASALARWLEVRGPCQASDALFIGFRREAATRRLTGDGLFKMVRGLGAKVGVNARPHGLRHAAVTTALDTFGGDYRRVQGFSRHANIQTVARYDDARRRQDGTVARRLGELTRPE